MDQQYFINAGLAKILHYMRLNKPIFLPFLLGESSTNPLTPELMAQILEDPLPADYKLT